MNWMTQPVPRANALAPVGAFAGAAHRSSAWGDAPDSVPPSFPASVPASVPASTPASVSARGTAEPITSRPMSAAARLIAQPPVDWSRFRAPLREQDRKLSKAAQDWLRSLPGSRWPMNLATHYPRIVNHLALVWPDRHLTDMYFERLLTDTRGGRQGFASAVLGDLLALRRLRAEMSAQEQVIKPWDLTLMGISDR